MNRLSRERLAFEPTGYQMIKSAEIKNFRCYSNAKLPDCRLINLIVGGNGSGKTSLLEALFLAAGGSAEIAFRLRHLRGYESSISGAPAEIEDALWRDLFHKFNKKSEVKVSLLGSELRNRAMTIRFNDNSSVVHSIGKRGRDDESTEETPITFDWVGPKGKRVIVKPKIRDGKIVLPAASLLAEETYFFPSGHNFSASETAKRFSDLSKTFKLDEVVAKYRKHFEKVEDLSIELIAGMPMVCAKIADMPEKIPLNLISSGMSKVASILFSIAHRNGSVALVDEIENGIHYRKLPVMWESLLDFCRSTDSQVFASSHSRECIQAAADLAAKHPKDFSVIQTSSNGALRQFGGEDFVEAIQQDIEIR